MAKDSTGSPLTSVTITALHSENLPPVPSSASYTFADMAYELGPDGATISPAISLSFPTPQCTGGQEFTVKTFDPQSGTWQDLPTMHDPNTGMITAEISHFSCFALFAKPLVSATPLPRATIPIPVHTQAAPAETPAPPPGTAFNIFIGMMGWATDLMLKNAYIVVIVAVLAIAYGMKKRRYPPRDYDISQNGHRVFLKVMLLTNPTDC